MDGEIIIIGGGAERLDDLRELYLAMHRHHRAVSHVPVTDPDEHAWRERRSTYDGWFNEGRALLHLAEVDGRAVGYAMTAIHAASDDSFPLAPRYAELYSLSVLPSFRGRGIGNRLLDRVDQHLGELGITNLIVAVMVGNVDAQRLYERRGLIPGETILYRFGSGLTGVESSTGASRS
jgi:ribosomal protein S18 acetylase RimI-like enzyme